MVMMAQPIYSAYMSIVKGLTKKTKGYIHDTTGNPINASTCYYVFRVWTCDRLMWHYEGIDERLLDEIVDEEISMDYVLTGGELPAMVFIDAVSRAIPGVLSSEESYLVRRMQMDSLNILNSHDQLISMGVEFLKYSFRTSFKDSGMENERITTLHP